jgi:hypothetical protein
MRTRLFTGVAGTAIALVTAALVAAPATAAPVPATVSGAGTQGGFEVVGQSVLTIEPTTLSSLEFNEIEHYAVLSEKSTEGATSYTFDVVPDPADGSTELFGGVLFVKGYRFAFVSHLVIDTVNRVVTGRVNFGAQTNLFALGANTAAGTAWHFTADAANVLNDRLAVTVLRPGRILGYSATTLTPPA